MNKLLLQNKTPSTFTSPYSSTVPKEEKFSSKYDFLQNLISQYELQIQQNLSFHKKITSQSPVLKNKLQPQSTSHHHQDTQDKTSPSFAFRKKSSNSLSPKDQTGDHPKPKLNQSLEESHNSIIQKFTATVNIEDNSPQEISVLMKRREERIEVKEFEEVSAKRQPDAQLDEQSDGIPLVESLIVPEGMTRKDQTREYERKQQIPQVPSPQFQQIQLQTPPQTDPNQPINPCYIITICFIFLSLLMLCI